MKNEKQKKYNRAQTAILGMRFEKIGEEWRLANEKTKTAMYKELFAMSKSNVERLFDGSGTEDNMLELAGKFELEIDEATRVNIKSVMELLKFRFSNEQYRKSFMALGMILYFVILIWISNQWWHCLGVVIAADVYLRNAKNIWGIKFNPTDKDRKYMKVLHIAAYIAIVILLVAGVQYSINCK